MTFIRRSGSALLIAAAMSLPTLASAEQAPSAMCDGEKAEQKQQQQPTADRSNQDNDKSKQKSDDKSDSNKSNDKSKSNQSGTQS
jgi:curli biogenesis system outer membrane secretion channel CsgG